MLRYVTSSAVQGIKNSYRAATYTPADAIIFLTYRCTSQCAACNIWKRPVNIDEELAWDDWQRILQKLVDSGTQSVELFGGDALLRKDLLTKMIRFCTDHGVKTFFPTNSSSMTRKTVGELVDAGLGTVYLSLDEVPEIGESVRGVKRHFERATKSIEAFKIARGDAKSPTVSCITTVSSSNFKYIDQLLTASQLAGADVHMLRCISEFTTDKVNRSDVNGILPSPYFMPTGKKSHAFSESEAHEVLHKLWEIRERKRSNEFWPMSIDTTNFDGLKPEHLMNLTFPKQECVFATTNIVISPYGNVLPCLYYKNYHLGNIKDKSIRQMWGSEKHRSFCRQQKKGRIPLCSECSIKFYHKKFVPTIKGFVNDAVNRLR